MFHNPSFTCDWYDFGSNGFCVFLHTCPWVLRTFSLIHLMVIRLLYALWMNRRPFFLDFVSSCSNISLAIHSKSNIKRKLDPFSHNVHFFLARTLSRLSLLRARVLFCTETKTKQHQKQEKYLGCNLWKYFC